MKVFIAWYKHKLKFSLELSCNNFHDTFISRIFPVALWFILADDVRDIRNTVGSGIIEISAFKE